MTTKTDIQYVVQGIPRENVQGFTLYEIDSVVDEYPGMDTYMFYDLVEVATVEVAHAGAIVVPVEDVVDAVAAALGVESIVDFS